MIVKEYIRAFEKLGLGMFVHFFITRYLTGESHLIKRILKNIWAIFEGALNFCVPTMAR